MLTVAKMARNKKQRQRSHSLLHLYPKAKTKDRLPSNAKIAAVTIEDPYGVPPDENAKLLVGKHTDQASGVVRTWQAPQQPRITVIQALRNDLLAKMFARHQIDQACYRAGRDYQALAETRLVSPAHSVDLSMPPIAGSKDFAEQHARITRASEALRKLELRVGRKYGSEGVFVIRSILSRGKSIEETAADLGQKTRRQIEFCGQLFRKALNELAEALGYVSHSVGKSRP